MNGRKRRRYIEMPDWLTTTWEDQLAWWADFVRPKPYPDPGPNALRLHCPHCTVSAPKPCIDSHGRPLPDDRVHQARQRLFDRLQPGPIDWSDPMLEPNSTKQ